MTTHEKILGGVMAILLVGLPVTWGNEPNDPNVTLTFEVRSPALGPFDASRLRQSGGPSTQAFAARKPAYAAGIPFEVPSSPYLARPGSGRMNDFLHFALGEALGMVGTDTHDQLSTAQKEFLRATEGLLDAERRWGGYVPQWYLPPDEPNSPEQLLLYAMTLEDAKAMVEAYVQFAMKRWHCDLDERGERIVELERSIAAAEERLEEVEKLAESSEQALNTVKQKVPYRTAKEAAEAIAELDRMLNAAQVDIAGIRARIDAIHRWQSELDDSKYKSMFIEESIALQGAEARKAMATQLRADASRFVDLLRTFQSATIEKEQIPAEMARRRKEMASLQPSLEKVRAEKPRITDRTIAIYPVEWTAESEGN